MHEVSIESSEGSGVQGLDPSQKSWPFIWLWGAKECVNGGFGSKGSSVPFLIRMGYWFQEG